MKSKRKKLLINLLNFERPLFLIKKELDKLEWDSEELIMLDKCHLINTLNIFLNDKISNIAIEEWANIIECRDDINYENYSDFIYELANPILTVPLTKERARQLLKKLK